MSCRENLTLAENQYGWDKEANVIFVDQPLSVGFSVLDVSMLWQPIGNVFSSSQPRIGSHGPLSTTSERLPMQDESGTVYDEAGVAEDMLQFLTEFRDAHESYLTAPLFITGESYGGAFLVLAARVAVLLGPSRAVNHECV